MPVDKFRCNIIDGINDENIPFSIAWVFVEIEEGQASQEIGFTVLMI